MDVVDGEYYLRRCGEDGLQGRHSSDDLQQRARALAALDVVSPKVALTVVEDYERARTVRGLVDDRRDFDNDIADEWTPPTIRSCGQTVQTDWGAITVHYVTIGVDESTLEVTMKQNPAAPGQSRYRGLHDGAPDLDLADDKGIALSSHFGGGGDGREWNGRYSVHPSLDPAAEFLTVRGQRVDLGPCPDDVAVRIEEVDPDRPAADRAARYLRRCLAAPSHHRFEPSSVPLAIDTFLALGILSPDADVIAEARNAQDVAEQAVPGLSPRTTRASPSTRGRLRLANRTVGVSVSLPGGVHVAITDLRVTSDGVTVGFQAAVTSTESLVRSLADCFALTTADDAGVEHPGELNDWGSGGGAFHGRMRLPTTVSAAASTFPLLLRVDRADVILDIPLHWDGAR